MALRHIQTTPYPKPAKLLIQIDTLMLFQWLSNLDKEITEYLSADEIAMRAAMGYGNFCEKVTTATRSN